MSLPWKKKGPLYIPSATQISQKQEHPQHPGFAFFSGHLEIFGAPASTQMIIERLKALNRFECLCSLSKIGLILEVRGYLKGDVQYELIREVKDSELEDRIQTLPPDQRIFFFELQLL